MPIMATARATADITSSQSHNHNTTGSTCFLCREEIKGVKGNYSSTNQQSISFILCAIIRIPNLKKFFRNNIRHWNDIRYCLWCANKISALWEIIEEYENMKEQIEDEKSKLESELINNLENNDVISREDSSSSSVEQILVQILNVMKSNSNKPSVAKCRNRGKFGKKLNRKHIRAMKDVTITSMVTMTVTPESEQLNLKLPSNVDLQLNLVGNDGCDQLEPDPEGLKHDMEENEDPEHLPENSSESCIVLDLTTEFNVFDNDEALLCIHDEMMMVEVEIEHNASDACVTSQEPMDESISLLLACNSDLDSPQKKYNSEFKSQKNEIQGSGTLQIGGEAGCSADANPHYRGNRHGLRKPIGEETNLPIRRLSRSIKQDQKPKKLLTLSSTYEKNPLLKKRKTYKEETLETAETDHTNCIRRNGFSPKIVKKRKKLNPVVILNRIEAVSERGGQFVCTECEDTFGKKWILELHKVTHSQERLYSCTECPRNFSEKKHLRKHMIIHSEFKSKVVQVLNLDSQFPVSKDTNFGQLGKRNSKYMDVECA